MVRYLRAEGPPPTSAEMRSNLDENAAACVFDGVRPLLRSDVDYDVAVARAWFADAFVPLLD